MIEVQLSCKCGAVCKEPKDVKRFKARHLENCKKEKFKEFNKQLAKGVRSVTTSQEENVDLFRLEMIESCGRNLTPWELAFVVDIRKKVLSTGGTDYLTANQRSHIEQIYVERVK